MKIQSLLKPETNQEKQQQIILMLVLLAGIGYYYFIWLPSEERRELETEIQGTLSKVATAQPQDYSALLTTCLNYSQWKDGNPIQQEALENKKEELNKAIDWLKEAERRMADENAQNRTREEEEKRQKELEIIKKKKLHWRRQRNKRSWTEDWISRRKDSFEKVLDDLGGEENINVFNTAADYTIHFPPSVWNGLTGEQKKLAESNGYGELKLDDKTRNFRYNQAVEDWEQQTTYNPVRGEPDPQTEKDNNALFYGTGGTGKTSLVRRIAYNSDCYPLVEIKGSNLSPRKEDYDNGVDALNKFIFTLCDIENTLEDDYGFARESNGEVRYILFVDEADNFHKIAAISDHTRLIFLKACMEGISKDAQSQNLWIFATNYLDLIDPPVYRPGRLSNPLDFSWTLGDFKYYCEKKGIINQFPQHWHNTDTLNDEDNKWVNRFNSSSFENEFSTFWRKFINHPKNRLQLEEEKEIDDKGGEKITKKGIQIGEMFEFFWRLFDSKQLPNFNGEYKKPKKPTTEEIMPSITEAIDVRLKELTEQLIQIKGQMIIQKTEYIGEINDNFGKIKIVLTEIAKKIN